MTSMCPKDNWAFVYAFNNSDWRLLCKMDLIAPNAWINQDNTYIH